MGGIVKSYGSYLLDMMGGMITIDDGRTKIIVLILARKKNCQTNG